MIINQAEGMLYNVFNDSYFMRALLHDGEYYHVEMMMPYELPYSIDTIERNSGSYRYYGIIETNEGWKYINITRRPEESLAYPLVGSDPWNASDPWNERRIIVQEDGENVCYSGEIRNIDFRYDMRDSHYCRNNLNTSRCRYITQDQIESFGMSIQELYKTIVDQFIDFTRWSIEQRDVLNECSMCGNLREEELVERPSSMRESGTQCICSHCLSELPRCDMCGERHFRDTFLQIDNDGHFNRVCTDCQENMTLRFCTRCGGAMTRERYDETNGICCHCSEDEPLLLSRINSYDYRPYAYNWLSNDDSCNRKNTKYVGVELELDNGRLDHFVNGVANTAIENGFDGHFYFMRDGSLSEKGVELTTMPMTIDYALNSFPWEMIHEEAKRYRMRSHDTKTCGMHIHISKAPIGNYELTSAKILLLFDKFYHELRCFGRRAKTQAYRWADKPNAYIESYDTTKSVSDKLERSSDHYKAVNLGQPTTIEFRLWKGTHNPDTIKATIDFTYALVECCETYALKTLYNMTWNEFVKIMLEKFCLYEGTIQYLQQRKLIGE